MKKAVALILTLILLFLCSACGGADASAEKTQGQTVGVDEPIVDAESNSLASYVHDYIGISPFRFDDYGSFTNIVIPIKNKGDKDIEQLVVWYQFIDHDGNEISQELNIADGLKAGESVELESSYDLSDVAIVRLNMIDIGINGAFSNLPLNTPIDFSVDKSDVNITLDEDVPDTDQGTEYAYMSKTEEYFATACGITKAELTKNALGLYQYGDFVFIEDDSDNIDSTFNRYHTLRPGAFYRKLARCLEAFSIGNSWQSYASYIIGFVPESREDFSPYVENAKTFITTETNPMTSILRKLETISVVSGSFDYENGNYDFSISDLTVCAEEMQISEEMLGYIFADMTEYAAELVFKGNSCTVHFHDYRLK